MPIIGKLGVITLHVSDIRSAKRFYEEVFGLKLIEFYEEGNWVEFDCDGTRIGLHVPVENEEGRDIGGPTGLFFDVADIKMTYDKLIQLGAKSSFEIRKQSWGDLVAGIFDQDRNEIIIRELAK